MSFASIQLTHLSSNDQNSTYSIKSFGYSGKREWEELGQLVLNKISKTYTFSPSELWIINKGIPPEVYTGDPDEISQVLETEYKDYSSGAWSIQINAIAKSMLQNHFFPQGSWSKHDLAQLIKSRLGEF
jgi:hypothetical protein